MGILGWELWREYPSFFFFLAFLLLFFFFSSPFDSISIYREFMIVLGIHLAYQDDFLRGSLLIPVRRSPVLYGHSYH